MHLHLVEIGITGNLGYNTLLDVLAGNSEFQAEPIRGMPLDARLSAQSCHEGV
jgi:hypothetical protein